MTAVAGRKPAPAAVHASIVLTALACAVWTAYTIGGPTGLVDVPALDAAENVLVVTPAALLLMALVWRPVSPMWLRFACGWTVLFAIAYESQRLTADDALLGLAPLVLGAVAIGAGRFPAITAAVAFALSGTHFSLEVFTHISIGSVGDVLLAGLWIAVLWSWATGRAETPKWVPWALVLLAFYLLISIAYVFAAEDLAQSAYAFRASCWYMAGVFVVALALRTPADEWTLQRGILLAGVLVGSYAMLRWSIGPSNAEEEQVRAGGPYVSDANDELRLFGSLPGPTALGVWCSVYIPFAIASALAPIGFRWRMVALVSAGMLGAALAGADTRVGMVATVAGSLVALTLFAVARGLEGRRALPLALGVILAVGGVGVFASAKLADSGSSERFRNILAPGRDVSVQERVVKWQTILDDLGDRPLGKGLGQSGAAEQKYARFASSASYDPDSSYVKIAYDQGVLVLGVFAAALLALLGGLAHRTVTAPTAQGSVLAMAACASLTAFAVAISAGVYIESLAALAPWVIVGLGYASWVRECTGSSHAA